ncbi:MAG TPA: transporter [Flavobacterium sp.]|jgi:hypothetical protein
MLLLRFVITGLLIASTASAQFTDVINSNRPGQSMAAFSVGRTVFQAETGLYGINENHDLLKYDASGYGAELNLRYGAFFEQFEIILESQYQRDHYQSETIDEYRSGLRQMRLGAKYLVYDPNKNYERKPNLYSWRANHSFNWHDFIPAVGVYAGFNMNFFNSPYSGLGEEKISPKVMLLTQNQFGRWVLVGNIYVDKIITNYMTYGYVVTVTRGFNDRWSGFIENQGIKSDLYADGIFRLGAAFLIKENIQVDASIGKNIKETPGIITGGIGLSWRFDENYKDVFIRAPEDEKGKDKDKKDKKAKKDKKKRVDEVGGEEKPE